MSDAMETEMPDEATSRQVNSGTMKVATGETVINGIYKPTGGPGP